MSLAPFPALPLADVLACAERALSGAELGALVAELASASGAAQPPRRLLLFLSAHGLWPQLQDAEFVAGLDARRLSSVRVARLAVSTAASADECAGTLLRLLRAGALARDDLLAPRVLRVLHAALRAWGVGGASSSASSSAPPAAAVAAAARLLRGVAEELDSFAAAGHFLAAFLRAEGSALSAAAERAILAAVCASADVRDLAGSPEALMAALPEHAAAIAEALAAGAHDSDADEGGNLAGFVCGDDEVDYSSQSGGGSDDDDDDDDDGGGGGGGGGGSDSSGDGSSDSEDDAEDEKPLVASAGARGSGGKASSAAAAAAAAASAAGRKRARVVVVDDDDDDDEPVRPATRLRAQAAAESSAAQGRQGAECAQAQRKQLQAELTRLAGQNDLSFMNSADVAAALTLLSKVGSKRKRLSTSQPISDVASRYIDSMAEH